MICQPVTNPAGGSAVYHYHQKPKGSSSGRQAVVPGGQEVKKGEEVGRIDLTLLGSHGG